MGCALAKIEVASSGSWRSTRRTIVDVEILSRLQFAGTIMFHYLFPPLSIGLGLQLFLCEFAFYRTRSPVWETAARFWTRVFAVNFAMGVATGIVMEFEFGTN